MEFLKRPMWIKSLRSNKESFKNVTFEKGFNVVIAERSPDSTERDSRNGVGKSTLIEIVHFCLGSEFKKSTLYNVDELKGWIFTAVINLKGKDISVSRGIDNPDTIFVDGDFSDWPTRPELDELSGAHIFDNDKWCSLLGEMVFNLPANPVKYSPSFRTLISYFARRGIEAYADPLTFFKAQNEWSKQTNSTYLLGLGYEYAIRFQNLKDDLEEIKNIKKVTGKGYFQNLVGSIGELEAERVNKTQEILEFKEQLETFKVHPQYAQIQKEADQLTVSIQELVNTRYLEETLKNRYASSLTEEEDVELELVESVYREVGAKFLDSIHKTLEEVTNFHKAILTNRRVYLEAEIERLERAIREKGSQIESLTEKRAATMSVLKSHGALEEHTRLSVKLAALEGDLESIKEKIAGLKDFEERQSELEIKKKDLVRLAKQDKDERAKIVDMAIALFNENAKALYESGGTLAIDIKETGYSIKPDLQRGRSQGIGYMKVFCFDLMVAQLQSLFFTPLFLIHDSTVFDGVDERQFAKALNLAATKSEEVGFQYICMLNSDIVPYKEFSTEFSEKFEASVKLRLNDGSVEGSLLGFRYA